MKFLEKYNNYILIVFMILILFRTCGVGSDISRINKQMTGLENKLDSIQKTNLTQPILYKSLQDNMWESLELEELSDKNKVPINQLKNERLKK